MFENQIEITDLGISPLSVVEEMAKDIRDKSDVECKFYESAEDVPDPRELGSEKKNLMVFDDLLLEKQITCESHYVRGRQSNVDCFYFIKTTSSCRVKQSERTRISFVFFLKIWKNLNHIFSMIMREVTWLRKNSDNYVRRLGKNCMGL